MMAPAVSGRSAPVHGARGSPAGLAAVEGAVAEVAAAGTDPGAVGLHLVDVLAVAHEEAIAAELAEEAVALGAGRALAERLLAALVTCEAVNLVIHLQREARDQRAIEHSHLHHSCQMQRGRCSRTST